MRRRGEDDRKYPHDDMGKVGRDCQCGPACSLRDMHDGMEMERGGPKEYAAELEGQVFVAQ